LIKTNLTKEKKTMQKYLQMAIVALVVVVLANYYLKPTLDSVFIPKPS